MTEGRLRARAFGRALEWRAALWLAFKGYRIIARNYIADGGEIDLVALSPERWIGRGTLCFVEVRGRANVEMASESVSPVKQTRVRTAVRAFLARKPHLQAWPRRYDLILAGRIGGLTHIRNAFDG